MKLSSLFCERGRRAARRRRPHLRLAVELCEDRSVPSGADVVSGDPKDWPMYNHDPEGSRYNSAETRLGPDNVSKLGVVWRFETPGAIAGTPAVVNDVVYAADSTGTVYAVNRDGQELWQTHLPVSSPFPISLTASPLVTNRTLIIGDLTGQIHGLDPSDTYRRNERSGDLRRPGVCRPGGHAVAHLQPVRRPSRRRDPCARPARQPRAIGGSRGTEQQRSRTRCPTGASTAERSGASLGPCRRERFGFAKYRHSHRRSRRDDARASRRPHHLAGRQRRWLGLVRRSDAAGRLRVHDYRQPG